MKASNSPINIPRGSVLIVVLVFALLISMIVTFSLESCVLQTKIARIYQYEVINFIDTEQNLHKTEIDMMDKGGSLQAPSHPKVQFIADTLIFGERQGLRFHELDVNQSGAEETNTHLQSVISLR
tara:strand:+ start:60860 stop:61234 length:375 start_codon:yes stop_codon:yes gene_type:complete